MFEISNRRCRFAGLMCGALVLSSCSIDAPVRVTDRPLAEQLHDRDRSDHGVVRTGQLANGAAPESLAFSEALAAGDFIRLRVTNEESHAALRDGPGPSYDLLAEVPGGAEVYGTGNQTGEWAHVLYADFEGWLRMKRVSLVSTASQEMLIVAADVDRTPVKYLVVGDAIGVNMRAEPDEASDLVGGAPVDAEVVGTGETERSWIEVTFDGVTGWASGNYLEPVGPESPLPETVVVEPMGTETE